MATAPENEVADDPDERTQPPFLRRVRIHGYKSIAFCDVTLQPLTILVGRNASGKSNFLDALAFLRDILNFGVNEAVKRHGGPEAIVCRQNADRSVLIEIECGYAVASDSWHATYRIEIVFPKKRPARISHEHLRLTQDKWWVGYTNNNGRVTCAAADDQPQDRLWKVKDRPFLDAYTDSPVPEFSESLETLTVYNFHSDVIRRLQAPNPGWFLERDGSNLASVIETTRENDEEVIERVGRYLSAITRFVELLGVVKYGDYETIRFRVTRNERDPLEFDAASMSDGTLRALAALIAAFQIVMPHGHPSLVAIEEPETSLHPAAMRALVDALDEATARTQILLTTHSTELLDNPHVRPENVRVVEIIDGQTVIGPVDEASLEIVRRKLDTLGGLERQNQLELDADDLERQQRLSRSESGAS
jgi:predicted ATPase